MFVNEGEAGAAGRRFATGTDSDSQKSTRSFRLRIEALLMKIERKQGRTPTPSGRVSVGIAC